VQTTLLGLAIAFIVALLAALIGPHFVDWNRFRPQFEAAATEMVGAPVRVAGPLEARLLPTPSLQLGSVTLGGPNDLGRAHADKLDVQFNLGDLMRGQWHASELTISGMSVDLGLDKKGRVEWPASNGTLNLASLSVERLNLTGRIALHDAASRSTLELNDISFSGDVRSLAGALSGSGHVTVDGARYPFRVSSGRSPDGNGARVHLSIDPGARPISADLDGVLTFSGRAPRFEGKAVLAVPPQKAKHAGTAATPWRISAKIKADHAGAQLREIKASYGDQEHTLRASGSGDARFGPSPLLHAVLSAHQLDADAFLAGGGSGKAAQPVRLWPALHALMAKLPRPPLPVQIEASAEQIMLGGRALQNVSATLHGNATSWAVDRLDLSAPGATRVVFNGVPSGASGNDVTGTLDIQSSDPEVLIDWLRGRRDIGFQSQKPLRLHGNVSVSPERVAITGLKAEINGGDVEGRLALSHLSANGGRRLDAALRAERLDLDAAASVARSIAGPPTDWPDQAALSLDVSHARVGGQELQPFALKVSYSPKLFALEHLQFGQAGGLAMEGSGSLDRHDATGILSLRANAGSLSRITALLAPLAPAVAQRIDAMDVPAGPAHLRVGLDLGKDFKQPDRAAARIRVSLGAPGLDATANLTAKPEMSAVLAPDLDRLKRSPISLTTKLSSGQAHVLLALLGLDGAVAGGKGPARFDGTVSGRWGAPLQVAAKISGAGIDADASGTAKPWGQDAKADVDLHVRKINLAPLFGLKPSDTLAQNISLSSHLSLAGNKLTFDDLNGTTPGSHLRGHLVLTLGKEKQLDGEIGLDALDLTPAFALAIGAGGQDTRQPLGSGLLKGWRGHIAFQALRGELPGGMELRPVSGTIDSDGQSLALKAIKGNIGGGEATATIDAKDGADGITLNARVQLRDVDGTALHYQGLKMPAGRTSLQMTLASRGRSVSALVGALSGNGMVTLKAARVSGLDPRAFDVAIRQSDSGGPTDEAKLRQIVEPALSAGTLPLPSAEIPFTITAGRVRVSPTTLDGKGGSAVISGGYDIPADQADIRATLTSTAIGPKGSHPEIRLFAAGPPDALNRNVDVSALSSWLAVRAIDRETKRLDAFERGEPVPPSTAALPAKPGATSSKPPLSDPHRPQPKANASPPLPQAAPTLSQQLAPLPPPIEVGPAPAPRPIRRRPKPKPAPPPLMLVPRAAINP
jgi:large subunit ribosomal protein L24